MSGYTRAARISVDYQTLSSKPASYLCNMITLEKRPSLKTADPTGQLLPVMEHFYTLQGEGVYTGAAAYFIRLGGCDVGCVWCDVKDSWPIDTHPVFSIAEIVATVLTTKAKIVVVTGGEPLMHPLGALTDALLAVGIRTHIETSGAGAMSGTWSWVTCSPKKFKPAQDEVLTAADELKVVVYHKSDLAWATTFIPKLKPNAVLLLQPEWSKRDEMLPLIIDFVQQNPEWRVSLQTHKWIGIE